MARSRKFLQASQSQSSGDSLPNLGVLPGVGYRRTFEKRSVLVQCCPGVRSLFGYKPEELIEPPRKPFMDFVHPDDRKRLRRIVQDHSDQNRPFYVEYRLLDREKQSHWVSDRGRVLHKDQSPVMIVGYLEPLRSGAGGQKQNFVSTSSQEHQLKFDYLTGLPRRHWFLEQVDGVLQSAGTSGEESGNRHVLAILDLDNFQEVNDFFGREIGDQVIQYFADLIDETFVGEAILGRLSGDRFGIFLPLAESESSTEYFRDRLAPFNRTCEFGDREVNQEFSVGISEYPTHAESLESLFTSANRALDRSKDQVNRKTAVFRESDLDNLKAHLAAKEDIMDALDRDRLELFHQPIVDSLSGSVRIQEALIRIRGRQGKLRTIDDFQEVIHEGKITRDLDHWILQKCFRDLKDSVGTPDLPQLSVNLFPPSVVDPGFFDDIHRLLEKTGFPADRLVIEIPETLMLSHREKATRNIQDAAEKYEFRFALDDFGVGHGSFKTLESLPLDFLKIDGSFIQGLPANSIEEKFVEMTVGVCEKMDLTVIGEWIETAETASLLEDLDLTLHQGYYYQAPRCVEDSLGERPGPQ